MKLISKTIFYYLLISLPLLIIAGLLSFYLIHSEVKDGTNESLIRERDNATIILNITQNDSTIYLSSDSLSKITSITSSRSGFTFSDTILFDKLEMEDVNYRVIKSFYTSNNRCYLITIAKPTFEEDELIEGLLSAFTLILVFLVLAFFVVNWVLSKTLWKPFYKTLNELSSYDIKKHQQKSFEATNIIEFNQLNAALNKMTEKINSDFSQQKEFTENASHEMQTPLAIAKANISLLMQSPNLKEDEMNQLHAIENTIKKLSALNKTLILLTKIDNNQFQENTTVNINEIITKSLENYSGLIETKDLKIDIDLKTALTIKMNPTLAEILVSNLLQNAIRHNMQGGKIIITTKVNLLSISNTGEALTISKEDLFVRFKKNDGSRDSLGLGLSIVKSIADNNNIKVNYSFTNDLHNFILTFN